jgi:hypothetical protein
MHFIPTDATGVPMQFIESAQLTAQKIADLSEILTIQKNAGALVSCSTETIQKGRSGALRVFIRGRADTSS